MSQQMRRGKEGERWMEKRDVRTGLVGSRDLVDRSLLGRAGRLLFVCACGDILDLRGQKTV